MPLPTVKRDTLVETTETHKLELSGVHLRELLLAAGYEIPRNAAIVFNVPGGGDWSNTPVDVDSESPVVVSWTMTKVEHGK